jgi:ketosteroid isomerase-like protein
MFSKPDDQSEAGNHSHSHIRRNVMKQLLVLILALVCVFPVWGQTAAEKELIKVENDWSTAWAKNDAKFLDQLYATEYLATSSEGTVYNKIDGIKDDTSPEYTEKSFVLSDLKVHIYGETAVVTGHNSVKFKKGGKVEQIEARFTDVFVKRDSRWQCVATQGTKVAKK